MNPNAYRDYQFVKGGDFDTPATIIEAVREWQEAYEAFDEWWLDEDSDPDDAKPLRDAMFAGIAKLRALRLPPVEEARRD